MSKVTVVGAGLAGCEAAYYLAKKGVEVTLVEMKPEKYTPAHTYQGYAELVCSNSLKANRLDSAAGLLKEEMRMLGSLCLESADKYSVAAGGALAVDRKLFSDYITEKIISCKNITIVNKELDKIPDGYCVIATGPLTSDKMAKAIKEKLNCEGLSFYDAAAPIVSFESVDMQKAFFQSRYDKGDGDDYINCPMNKPEFEEFESALQTAETAPLKEFDKQDFKVYEGCMPIEVMAKRGNNTIRFGPMKPVGLVDPNTGHRPWANLQLRRENVEGTMYNLVGFQTNLKFGEQKRVFSMIPALKNAEFLRYGIMHRNTFINSPKLLENGFSLKEDNRIYFAGQITGVEGYMESAMSGIVAGINMYNKINGKANVVFPLETMIGSLCNYVVSASEKNFQPMGANMGVIPPLKEHERDKRLRYEKIANRAVLKMQETLKIID